MTKNILYFIVLPFMNFCPPLSPILLFIISYLWLIFVRKYKIENFRNKQLESSKLCIILTMVIKSCTFPLCPAQNISQPFANHIYL
jgi:hypothetical protein